ncbi:DUF4189 domain-containing protein [Variovorax ginsengisoli]|uniref:Type IV secretory pathway VirB6-like protein n=1 Tax=Variovorax ginsengisoli TaxID=363844 RepID=A0ABT9SDR3_9BURK|nr:DUF4189 domain-containing protein [Variovorax ginsengisoli]MDP9902501.1 type IV secretory pathway VirB6-like protein [Variovorax ginsengisoli]
MTAPAQCAASRRPAFLLALVGLLALLVLGSPRPSLAADAPPTLAAAVPSPSWGAIASMASPTSSAYGFSFNQRTRDAAERAALAQCEKTTGRAGSCAVRAYFNRACGALAAGNYGEWGTGLAATADAAGKAAASQCDSHLPTQPCKTLVQVCSPR